MNAGKVQWLVMLGVNPLYSAPVDLEFAAAFDKVPNTVHLGSHVDETGAVSVWHINKAHYLESWSDARAYDGTISIIQPMIAPMYGGHSAHEVLQTLLDNPQVSAYDAVLANAKTYIKGDFASGVAQGAARWLGGRHGVYGELGDVRRLARSAASSCEPGAAGGVGDSLQARSVALRRPLCQCGLAAGAAQAGYESELGQRRADELRDRGGAEARAERRGRDRRERAQGDCAAR